MMLIDASSISRLCVSGRRRSTIAAASRMANATMLVVFDHTIIEAPRNRSEPPLRGEFRHRVGRRDASGNDHREANRRAGPAQRPVQGRAAPGHERCLQSEREEP